jgi:hypothetical protein
MPRATTLLCTAVFLSTLAGARVSYAQPSDDPRKAQAEALLQDGIRLEQAGKKDEALKKFQQAYATYPSPNALYNLAQAERAAQRSAEALRYFRACLKSPLLAPANVPPAKDAIAELEPKTGRVDIATDEGAEVVVDGVKIDGRAPFADPIDVSVGQHVIDVHHGDKTASKIVTVGAAQVVHIDIAITVTTTPPPHGPGDIVEPPKTETRAVAFPPPTGAIILGGAGIVGLGLGVGFGIDSQSKKSDFQNGDCTHVASSACNDAHSAVGTASTVSIVGYIAGGVLLAGGVVWWLVAPRHETRSIAIHPVVTPTASGMFAVGTF